MCKWGTVKKVKVLIPADLSYIGKKRWKFAKIDSCIASIVKALQKEGINMRGSCCGHYKTDGHIELQDGRLLVIRRQDKYKYGCIKINRKREGDQE